VTWAVLLALLGTLAVSVLVGWARRAELARMARGVAERDLALRQGSARAQLRHPVIDLSRCLGCATCVSACPEDGVLEIVHGQAMVVHGARCVGVSACERECPVGAITVTLADADQRRDVPVLTDGLESPDVPGLFLAGEVTAQSLIRTAVEHGVAVAAEVARRRAPQTAPEGALDLVIVGAGPAGLACALEAKRQGLTYVLLDQAAEVGGTVAKYPRRKLVLTQPVELPLYGRFRRTSYTKEELVELWHEIAREQSLAFSPGETFEGLEREPGGGFVVVTSRARRAAAHVCLAVGRRGVPRRLGVPGEELAKVAYGLLDAHGYQSRRVLVVGGGDSAVETALALAEQPGNAVTLSYRKEAFFRLRERNRERLESARADGRLAILQRSEVRAIEERRVALAVEDAAGCSGPSTTWIDNDDVFVMIGGQAPLELLERSGVSFDPARRPGVTTVAEQGTGLQRALTIGLVLTLGALCWALAHADYYLLPLPMRPTHADHAWLRPGMGFGLGMGIACAGLIVLNLLYLLRRNARPALQVGSLKAWMTSHVATGILALLCATLHAAMAPRASTAGHAWQALVVLLVTGAIGRYVYAAVPRAANGRELDLFELKQRLGRMAAEWDGGQRRFREAARARVSACIEARQWRSGVLGRIAALVGAQFERRRLVRELRALGAAEGVAADHVEETVELARRAHRTALAAAHFEDVRALLNSWRYLHRWVAALMVLLVVLHVIYALTYGTFGGEA
jgi:thioredoxin reductase